ncbi:addiction module protein [Prosthecobacter vanneervenii]|uniref:Sugar phosphate isomerase/epimerase n=1 Tax=Prosthecobacter vanneervenii TaxID=48466 RepID=A0A7W8DKD2_9BACT|nr:addiction module protein [Prosthecobacter vanneervenii]MBB5032930.1 sugar phosphate isomerase/epimerase [Prosthecobacter vanneervenii]
MTATVERIKQEIRSLAPEEVDELLRDLQNEYSMPSPAGDDEASIEAEWDAEIDRRVREIEEGKVELISGEELRRSTDALMEELGLKRLA